MTYDMFISHASEDKAAFVGPLAQQLRMEGFRVWYDEFELKLGDSIVERIDYGLANSRAGLVVLSPFFIAKKWPRRELAGLSTLHMNRNVILIPIWHNVTLDDVMAFSPPLADLKSIASDEGMDKIAAGIKRVLAPMAQDSFGDPIHTIEEAQELIAKGAVAAAYSVALRSLDQRIFQISSTLALRVPREYPPGHPLETSPVMRAMKYMVDTGHAKAVDELGTIDIGLLWKGLSGLQALFISPEPPAPEIQSKFVQEASRFIRANPMRVDRSDVGNPHGSAS